MTSHDNEGNYAVDKRGGKSVVVYVDVNNKEERSQDGDEEARRGGGRSWSYQAIGSGDKGHRRQSKRRSEV